MISFTEKTLYLRRHFNTTAIAAKTDHRILPMTGSFSIRLMFCRYSILFRQMSLKLGLNYLADELHLLTFSDHFDAIAEMQMLHFLKLLSKNLAKQPSGMVGCCVQFSGSVSKCVAQKNEGKANSNHSFLYTVNSISQGTWLQEEIHQRI